MFLGWAYSWILNIFKWLNGLWAFATIHRHLYPSLLSLLVYCPIPVVCLVFTVNWRTSSHRGKREFHLKNGLWPFCENVLIDVGGPSTIWRQVSLGCVREPAKSELEREPVYIPLCWVSGARCLPSFYVGAEGEGGSHACVCALNTLR